MEAGCDAGDLGVIFNTRYFGGFRRKRDILAVGSGSMTAWSGDGGEVLSSRL